MVRSENLRWDIFKIFTIASQNNFIKQSQNHVPLVILDLQRGFHHIQDYKNAVSFFFNIILQKTCLYFYLISYSNLHKLHWCSCSDYFSTRFLALFTHPTDKASSPNHILKSTFQISPNELLLPSPVVSLCIPLGS